MTYDFLVAVCKYEIETYTGDEENAETKATPYIVLFNQTGNSGKRRLLASTNTKPHEMFKRNQVCPLWSWLRFVLLSFVLLNFVLLSSESNKNIKMCLFDSG